MTQYDNTNRGAIFKNDRKEKDKHPDYKGSVNADGVEYWVSAWIKEGKKGKFFSLSLTQKQDQQTHKGFDSQGDIPQTIVDDEIPF